MCVLAGCEEARRKVSGAGEWGARGRFERLANARVVHWSGVPRVLRCSLTLFLAAASALSMRHCASSSALHRFVHRANVCCAHLSSASWRADNRLHWHAHPPLCSNSRQALGAFTTHLPQWSAARLPSSWVSNTQRSDERGRRARFFALLCSLFSVLCCVLSWLNESSGPSHYTHLLAEAAAAAGPSSSSSQNDGAAACIVMNTTIIPAATAHACKPDWRSWPCITVSRRSQPH